MNGKDLLQEMGEIDLKFVQEAMRTGSLKKLKKRKLMKRVTLAVSAAAACAACVIMSGLFLNQKGVAQKGPAVIVPKEENFEQKAESYQRIPVYCPKVQWGMSGTGLSAEFGDPNATKLDREGQILIYKDRESKLGFCDSIEFYISSTKLIGTDNKRYSCGLYQIDFVLSETDPEALWKQLDDFYFGLSGGESSYEMLSSEGVPQVTAYYNEAWLTENLSKPWRDSYETIIRRNSEEEFVSEDAALMTVSMITDSQKQKLQVRLQAKQAVILRIADLCLMQDER